jgi:hypothetical protein
MGREFPSGQGSSLSTQDHFVVEREVVWRRKSRGSVVISRSQG